MVACTVQSEQYGTNSLKTQRLFCRLGTKRENEEQLASFQVCAAASEGAGVLGLPLCAASAAAAAACSAGQPANSRPRWPSAAAGQALIS